MNTAELPNFQSAPAWMDFEGQVWERSGDFLGFGEDTMRVDSERASRLAPWTPLDTAEEWAKRIDRDKLAEVVDTTLQRWHDGDGDQTDHDSVADAVLAALPELMGGEVR